MSRGRAVGPSDKVIRETEMSPMRTPCPLQHLLCALAVLALAPQTPAQAQQSVADFYRGKTINLHVGFPPGGGYDLYARVVAPYFSRHIPGNPSIVVKSMLGGSGIMAAGYMSNITPQDGTSLGLFLGPTSRGKR